MINAIILNDMFILFVFFSGICCCILITLLLGQLAYYMRYITICILSFKVLFQYSLTPIQYLNLAYDTFLVVNLTLQYWHELIIPILCTLMLRPFFNLIVSILIKDNSYKDSLLLIINFVIVMLSITLFHPRYNAYIIETELLTTSLEIYPLWF